MRYGYGFVQGADAAAAETGAKVTLNYTYANQFKGDADITAAMDTWYSAGTKCVFACGGGVYTSAAEAAAKVNGKVIGVDVDQSAIIDGQYGKGMKYLPAGAPALEMILVVVLCAILVGMLYSLLLAVACINFKADQTLVGTAMNLLGTAAATVIVKAINTAESPDNVSSTIQYVAAKKAFIVRIGSFEFNWFMEITISPRGRSPVESSRSPAVSGVGG